MAPSPPSPSVPCVVFVVWGDKYVAEVPACVERSPGIAGLPVVLITDTETAVPELAGIEVIRADFSMTGHYRKSEMWRFLPETYDDFVFLDTDISVVGDISLGFEKARQHGVAMVLSNHYLLDDFKTFGDIMVEEGVGRRGIAQYNTGVIFFSRGKKTEKAFGLWQTLCEKYYPREKTGRLTDQPYFSLAMELAGLVPYTLSRNFNYRPNQDPVIGEIRLWHSWAKVPSNLNSEPPTWRRFDHARGAMVPAVKTSPFQKQLKQLKRSISRRLGRSQ